MGKLISMPFTHRLSPVRTVLIVGTFRSATNVTKAALKSHYRVRPVFNKWFWKHGMPPTLPETPAPIPSHVPILVMSKDPVPLNESLFRFWRARRKELKVGDDISDFVRNRFTVYDNSGGKTRPRYIFASPTEYWNQFYYSWLNWRAVRDQVQFIRCEDLMADPDAVLNAVGARFELRRRSVGIMALPDTRVGPKAPPALEDGIRGLSLDDKGWIRRHTDPAIAAKLGYPAGA